MQLTVLGNLMLIVDRKHQYLNLPSTGVAHMPLHVMGILAEGAIAGGALFAS